MLVGEKEAIGSLSEFIKLLVAAGVKTRSEFRAWCKANEERMKKLFWYPVNPGYPDIRSLVNADFHPTLPLILLNYSPVAHNALHGAKHDGWTTPLRLCRGIVFDRLGNLVALPFPKFFNYGEHPETTPPFPDDDFEVTEKYDGHLGIIFNYRGKFHITTRGSFTSPTNLLADKMLQKYVKTNNWSRYFPHGETILVEIIHPKTKVHVAYRGKRFVLIGSRSIISNNDSCYRELLLLSGCLGLPVANIWQGNSLAKLKTLMKNRSIHNKEGFVIHFSDGRRVKVKFITYIGRMVAAKLSYGYLIKRILGNNLEKMITTLPEEILEKAREMIDQLMRVEALKKSGLKEKRVYLYNLDPKSKDKTSYRGACNKLLRHLNLV